MFKKLKFIFIFHCFNETFTFKKVFFVTSIRLIGYFCSDKVIHYPLLCNQPAAGFHLEACFIYIYWLSLPV